jgi:Zn-dependent alcohol dehydrogenase
VVVSQEGAVVVGGDGRTDQPDFASLATLGCAVVTGVGAVLTAARVPAGAKVAVIGAGGVGLNAVQGAVLAGCERVIAIDRRREPLEMATRFGATDVIEAPLNVAEAVRELTGGRGADYVFDTVGTPGTLSDAFAATRKGGSVVLTGLSRLDAIGNVPMFPLVMQEKRLIGSVYGSGRPTEDILRLVEWNRQGKLKLKELVGQTYELAQINEALNALGSSAAARGVVLP